MKRFIFLSCLLLLSVQIVHGQSLEETFQKEVKYRKTGMTVLGSWAVLNIGSGLALRGNAEGSTRYFYDMNAIWNSVNLGIATFGYIRANHLTQPENGLGMYNVQNRLDKVLLINIGLDLAYIATGLFLNDRGRRSTNNRDLLVGYGKSVVLQGVFLFAFDVTMILVHKKIRIADDKILSINAMPSGFSASLIF